MHQTSFQQLCGNNTTVANVQKNASDTVQEVLIFQEVILPRENRSEIVIAHKIVT